MKQRHVIVVGGGASGLVAAITAAREGAKVSIIEQKERLGKKILSTGNGRCNLTNEYMESSCFRRDDMMLVEHILSKFGYQDTIEFFESLGVVLKDRQGYVYPISDQASTIVDVLVMELKNLGVSIFLEETVKQISLTKKGYLVQTNKGAYVGNAVILCTGGKAAPVLGSDGSGYALAKKMGHHMSPVVPALVQLKGKGTIFKQVSGVRTNAKVTAIIDGKACSSDTGELQLTNYGISGIPVFQISRYVAKALQAKQKATVEVDFFPQLSDTEYEQFLKERLKTQGHKKAEDFFVGMYHQKLISLFMKISRIQPNELISNITDDQLQLFQKVTKHFLVDIEGTNNFDQAQICAGGVLTTEVNKDTLESIYANAFYLTGELLDVDGICGGYNLQWAWATGYIAGKSAAKGK